MDLHQRLGHHRIRYIVDSYMLMGGEPQAKSQFEAYIDELISQYPHGLIELALVETLSKNWLTVPMQKGVAFLSSAHERIKQWQSEQRASARLSITVTPSQFSQITGLDSQVAFASVMDAAAVDLSLVEQRNYDSAYPTSATVD
ncbi:MAG: hypothetical protein AAF703_06005 [Cyanobacteria bacterium P01_D01_bin.105]